MSVKLRVPLLLVTLIGAWIAPAQSHAGDVTWHADRAIAGGSACRSTGPFADTWFIAAGKEISVIFAGMGVDLTPASAVNTAVHSCLMRIPLTVGRKVRLGKLTQRVHWGFAKDHHTEAEITAGGTLFGKPTTPIVKYVGPGVKGVMSWLTEEVVDYDFHPGYICPSHPTTGLLQVNLAVAARREHPSKDISVRIHGEDIEYDALIHFTPCP